ncbi:MAG: alpha/beta hydrolase [Deltaproteobacteria bacterium]|nr:alpha/beta hydrolase [Deltaproteobacteria bacterium]
MLKKVARLAILGFGLLLLLTMRDTMERSFLYFPERGFPATPDSIGLSFDDQFFQAPSGRKLHGWFVPHPAAKASLLFFHGNAGNISHRLEKLKILNELEVSVFIIDYAGYGKSEGKPSEANLYEDGLAAYQHAVEVLKIDPGRLFLYGESLGSAVAIELAHRQKTAGIILEGAFTSLKDLAKNHMPFLSALARDQYKNLEKIASVSVPILFIHAKRDEICPFAMAEQLFEKAPQPKQAVWLEQGGHNDGFWVDRETYRGAIRDFLENYKRR